MGKIYHFIKRIIDLLISLIFLIILLPILLILSILIYISAGMPIIFISKRLGKNKKEFPVLKFRTLVNGIKRRKDGLSDKILINKLAGYMRETHLDEILQLINVITGSMALIGPRPLDIPRYNHIKKESKSWDYIFKVKPGMTCINQIARYDKGSIYKIKELKGLSNLERRNRLILDRYYIKNESPLLDLKITFWTLSYLIRGFFTKIF